MLKKEFVRLAAIRRRTLVIAVALMAPLACLGIASPALAKEPTGRYTPFGQCPRFTGAELCDYAEITGGELVLGNLTVPFTNPTPFQFGLHENAAEELEVLPALNGVTLAPTPEPVPGGLSSLLNCDEIKGQGYLDQVRRALCRGLFRDPWLTGVTETTELAEPTSAIAISTSNDLFEEGIALRLPVKIHLENPLLGRDCYIGSEAEPIVWNFTTGETNPPPPNQPTHGHFGTLAILEEGEFVEDTGHYELDNAFAAPAATGCGWFPTRFINSMINNKVGLPSPAGHNTIVHIGFNKEAVAAAVIASEQ